jgi:hypothetical protein
MRACQRQGPSTSEASNEIRCSQRCRSGFTAGTATETSAFMPGQAAVRAAIRDCTVLRITDNALATIRLGLVAAART